MTGTVGFITGTGLYELRGRRGPPGRVGRDALRHGGGRHGPAGRRPGRARGPPRAGARPPVASGDAARHRGGHGRGGRRLPGLHHGVRRPRPVPGARVAGRVRRPPLPSNRLADGSLCTLFTSPEIPGGATGSTTARSASGPAPPSSRGPGTPGWRCVTGAPTVMWTAPLQLGQRDRPVGRGRRGLREPDRGPEAVLAGEARLPFALMGFVTDHATGWAPSRRPTRRSRGCSARAPGSSSAPCWRRSRGWRRARRAGRDPVRDLGPGPRPVRRRPGRHRLRA